MSVNTLHIEASSFCNARCPGCPRNAYGYPLEGFYDERNLKIDQLKEILSQFTDVYHILYCGNHGDPGLCKELIPIFQYFKSHNPKIFLSVVTNGGMRPTHWWEELAGIADKVTFSDSNPVPGNKGD